MQEIEIWFEYKDMSFNIILNPDATLREQLDEMLDGHWTEKYLEIVDIKFTNKIGAV